MIAKSALCARISQEAAGEAPVAPENLIAGAKLSQSIRRNAVDVLLPAGRNHTNAVHSKIGNDKHARVRIREALENCGAVRYNEAWNSRSGNTFAMTFLPLTN